MGRSWREEYNGGIYHVISRGNNMAGQKGKTPNTVQRVRNSD